MDTTTTEQLCAKLREISRLVMTAHGECENSEGSLHDWVDRDELNAAVAKLDAVIVELGGQP